MVRKRRNARVQRSNRPQFTCNRCKNSKSTEDFSIETLSTGRKICMTCEIELLSFEGCEGTSVSNNFQEQRESLARTIIPLIRCDYCPRMDTMDSFLDYEFYPRKRICTECKIRMTNCIICSIDKLPHDFPTPETRPSCCSEVPSLCLFCVEEYLSKTLPAEPLYTVKCPQCHKSWDQEFIVLYSTPESYAHAEHRQIVNAIEDCPDFRRCRNCGEGQLCPNGDAEPIITCWRCKAKSCFMHCEVWVVDKGCPACNDDGERHQRFERLEEERLQNEQYLQRRMLQGLLKNCPYCGALIEKDHGCDHMICTNRSCGIHFCWTCRALASRLPLPHQFGCPWTSRY